MEINIRSVQDLGHLLRAVRKSSGVRLDDLAGFSGVSKQFVSDLEHGKQTVRLGLVLQVLNEMGVTLKVDIPEAARASFSRLAGEPSSKWAKQD